MIEHNVMSQQDEARGSLWFAHIVYLFVYPLCDWQAELLHFACLQLI